MATALARADLVVARSGAMTVSEIALAGRPADFRSLSVPSRPPAGTQRAGDRAARRGRDCRRRRASGRKSRRVALRELTRRPGAADRDGPRRRARRRKPDAAARIAQVCFEIAGSREAQPHERTAPNGLLTRQRRLHFIGVGGAGMSGIAELCPAARLRGQRLRSAPAPPSGSPRWACESSRAIILSTLRAHCDRGRIIPSPSGGAGALTR